MQFRFYLQGENACITLLKVCLVICKKLVNRYNLQAFLCISAIDVIVLPLNIVFRGVGTPFTFRVK